MHAEEWAGIGRSIYALGEDDFKQQWLLLQTEDKRSIPEPWFSRCANRFSIIARPNGHNGHEIPPAVEDLEDDIPEPPKRNVLDWTALAAKEPPPFEWWWDHWLSPDPTLLSGIGGVGKSLLAQQIATSLAINRPLWGESHQRLRVLYWACEDNLNEIWRRQDRICKKLGIGFDMLTELKIDARRGFDNTLMAMDFSRPVWTHAFNELKEQVHDYKADVLILDNTSHLFGGNENDRNQVTTFENGIVGIVKDRPFCPLTIGHVAKIKGSEYAGSTAWENAVRMRWYLAEKLPGEAGADQTEPDTEVTSDTRFLCKRKTNYSTKDYVQFTFEDGVFVVNQPPEDPSRGGMMDSLRAQRANTIVLQAVRRLAEMGIHCGEAKGPNYLPSKILDMKLGDGASKPELRAAMNALMVAGDLVRSEVGRYSKGAPKYGLTVSPKT